MSSHQQQNNFKASCGLELLRETSRIRIPWRKRVWLACGEIMDRFDNEIMPEIEALLQNEAPRYVEYYFSVVMLGNRQENAKPKILVSCINRDVRTEILRIVKDSKHIRDAYPEFGFGESSLPLHEPVASVPLAGEVKSKSRTTPHSIPSISDVLSARNAISDKVLASDRSPSIGRKLCLATAGNNESARYATGGIVVRIGDKYYQKTVGHIDEPESITMPQWSGDDVDYCRFDDDSGDDDDDALEFDYEITSRASVTPEDNLSQAESESCSGGSGTASIGMTFGSSFRPGRYHYLTAEGDSILNLVHRLPRSDGGVDVPRSMNSVGRLQHNSRNGKKPGLDYTLVLLDATFDLQKVNQICLDSNTDKYLQIRGIEAVPVVEREIITATASGGITRGKLSPGAVYFRTPQQNSFQKLYIVHLSTVVVDGDCGADVVDQETGNVYGHIVRGCRGANIAYIVSAKDIFEDLQQRMGAMPVIPTNDEKFNIQTSNDQMSIDQTSNDLRVIEPTPKEKRSNRPQPVEYRGALRYSEALELARQAESTAWDRRRAQLSSNLAICSISLYNFEASSWFSNDEDGLYVSPKLKDNPMKDGIAPWSNPQTSRYNYTLDKPEGSANTNNGNERLEGIVSLPPAPFISGCGNPLDQQSSFCSSESLHFGNREHGFDPETHSDGMLSPRAPYDQWPPEGEQFVYLPDTSANKPGLIFDCQESKRMFNDDDIRSTIRGSESSNCSSYGTGLPNQRPSESSSAGQFVEQSLDKPELAEDMSPIDECANVPTISELCSKFTIGSKLDRSDAIKRLKMNTTDRSQLFIIDDSSLRTPAPDFRPRQNNSIERFFANGDRAWLWKERQKPFDRSARRSDSNPLIKLIQAMSRMLGNRRSMDADILFCPFRGHAGCGKWFPTMGYDRWIAHIADDHLCHLPSKSICWAVDDCEPDCSKNRPAVTLDICAASKIQSVQAATESSYYFHGNEMAVTSQSEHDHQVMEHPEMAQVSGKINGVALSRLVQENTQVSGPLIELTNLEESSEEVSWKIHSRGLKPLDPPGGNMVKGKDFATILGEHDHPVVDGPDRIADHVSDFIHDVILDGEPISKVVCETVNKTGMVIVFDEETTNANLGDQKAVPAAIKDVDYESFDKSFEHQTCHLAVDIEQQPPDIYQNIRYDPALKVVGDGHLGLMFGYASDETSDTHPGNLICLTDSKSLSDDEITKTRHYSHDIAKQSIGSIATPNTPFRHGQMRPRGVLQYLERAWPAHDVAVSYTITASQICDEDAHSLEPGRAHEELPQERRMTQGRLDHGLISKKALNEIMNAGRPDVSDTRIDSQTFHPELPFGMNRDSRQHLGAQAELPMAPILQHATLEHYPVTQKTSYSTTSMIDPQSSGPDDEEGCFCCENCQNR